MKKKFISLLLVFIFSFGLLSGATQEKTEAISIVGGISIVKVIGMLLGGATLIAGGAVVGDSIINPDDNHAFTDWLQNEYATYIRDHQQLPGQPPPDPKELTPMEHAALTSLLTKQGIDVGTDIYSAMAEYFKPDEVNNIPEDIENYQTNVLQTGTMFGIALSTAQSFNIGDQLKYVYTVNGQNAIYVTQTIIPNTSSYKDIYPKAIETIVTSINNISNTLINQVTSSKHFSSYDNAWINGLYTFNLKSNSLGSVRPYIIDFDNPFIPPEPKHIPEILTPPNIVPEEQFVPTFHGYDLSPLSGLVTSNQEMIDIVTGAKQVSPTRYQAIQEAWNEVLQNYLKNPNFTGNPTEPVEPKVNPTTGMVDYEELPEQPNTDPENEPTELTALNKALYWLKGIWYGIRDLPGHISDAFSWLKAWINTFWTKVNTLIDDFWMRFSTWWQDNFVVHWTAFIDWLHTLPGLISGAFTGLFDLVTIPLNALVGLLQDVWNWLQGVPEMIYGLFVPPSTDIAEVWDPLILLWNDKLEPVKAPLDQLLFYETELQDISANLEFNGIGGTYKIIDYQYVKSVKDQVKGIIRAFFWILIIFFNVDQVHRLIRNQGIIKSYVRKLDEPGGKS